MRLARGSQGTAAIALTPLVDVMLILLVFFMVTSTYLDLDMIPVGRGGEAPGPAAAGAGPGTDAPTLLLRLGSGGGVIHRGRALTPEGLGRLLSGNAGGTVLILPSGTATAQALVTVMEAAANAGVADARIVRIEGGGGLR